MAIRGIKGLLISGFVTISMLTCGLAFQADTAMAAENKSISALLETLKKTRNDSNWLVKMYQSVSAGFGEKYIRVKEQVVNVRSGPGTGYEKIGTVKAGQILSVKAQSGDWYKIDMGNGKQGWIAGWLVILETKPVNQPPQEEPPAPQEPEGPQNPQTPETPSDSVPIDVTDKYLIIKENVVNVRSGPGTQYGIVLKAKIGERYVITQQYGDWYRVTLPDKSLGWIAAWLVDVRTITEPSRGDSGYDPPQNEQPDDENEIPAEPVKLTGIDTSYPFGGLESVTIHSEDTIVYKVSYMKNPDRLVIDIKNSDINGLTDVSTSGYFVNMVRVAQYSTAPYVARIVLDLTASVSYKAELINQGRSLIISVEEASIKNKTIVVDAGHGGYDPGAIGITGLKEKDYNLSTALLLRDKLAAMGANVIMTRDDDTFISLTERCTIANQAQADIFVSIHANSSTNASVNGTSTYYYAPSSNQNLYAQLSQRKKLANLVQTKLAAALGTRNIGILQENFAVLRGTNMPSILVESAFLSNAADEAILKDEVKHEIIAEAIAAAIEEYFTS